MKNLSKPLKQFIFSFALLLAGSTSVFASAPNVGNIESGNYNVSFMTVSWDENAQAYSLGKDQQYDCAYDGKADLNLDTSMITFTVRSDNKFSTPKPDCTIYQKKNTYTIPVKLSPDKHTLTLSMRPIDDPNYNKYIVSVPLLGDGYLYGYGPLPNAIDGYPKLVYGFMLTKYKEEH